MDNLFSRGGKRPGSGRKKGVKTGPVKSYNERKRTLSITLPNWAIDQLKSEHKNLSKYIFNLIQEDYESKDLPFCQPE